MSGYRYISDIGKIFFSSTFYEMAHYTFAIINLDFIINKKKTK